MKPAISWGNTSGHRWIFQRSRLVESVAHCILCKASLIFTRHDGHGTRCGAKLEVDTCWRAGITTGTPGPPGCNTLNVHVLIWKEEKRHQVCWRWWWGQTVGFQSSLESLELLQSSDMMQLNAVECHKCHNWQDDWQGVIICLLMIIILRIDHRPWVPLVPRAVPIWSWQPAPRSSEELLSSTLTHQWTRGAIFSSEQKTKSSTNHVHERTILCSRTAF